MNRLLAGVGGVALAGFLYVAGVSSYSSLNAPISTVKEKKIVSTQKESGGIGDVVGCSVALEGIEGKIVFKRIDFCTNLRDGDSVDITYTPPYDNLADRIVGFGSSFRNDGYKITRIR